MRNVLTLLPSLLFLSSISFGAAPPPPPAPGAQTVTVGTEKPILTVSTGCTLTCMDDYGAPHTEEVTAPPFSEIVGSPQNACKVVLGSSESECKVGVVTRVACTHSIILFGLVFSSSCSSSIDPLD